MKNTLPKALVALAILILLPGCFWNSDEPSSSGSTEIENSENAEVVEPVVKEVPETFYISKSASECESIFFTCPEGRAFFTDKKGCGCTNDEDAASTEQLGLGDLIRGHLAANLIEPQCDGGVLAEFVYIDEGETESGNLNYDVWAIVRELCADGAGATFDGAVAFEIEQSDFTRVVRDFTAVSPDETDKIQKQFTEKAAEWILAKENPTRTAVLAELADNIEKRMGRMQTQISATEELVEEVEPAGETTEN